MMRFKDGLNAQIVSAISQEKQEPQWMLEKRLQALAVFEQKPMPQWGADLSELETQSLSYYVRSLGSEHRTWDDVPPEIKETFDKLGVPQAERDLLAGVGAQFDSEVFYKSLHAKWAKRGVVFLSMDDALKQYPEMVKTYFGTVIPHHDNKFAALNTAVWSGGSFVYVPRGVHVDLPLQAYFRINAQSMGQFERTLIIADEGSFFHYVEGCCAPVYKRNSLHSAVVEIIALPGAHVRYTTIQNWSGDVYNLVTKRAIAHERATVEWIDGNFGSKVTMKYPCIILKGAHSKGQIISIAVAGKGQHQDSGGKIIHAADHTSSTIIAKSVSKDGGRSSYRGLLRVPAHTKKVKAHVQCDALLLDEHSRTDTYPSIIVSASDAQVGHEASVSNVSQEQLYYLMSRGYSAQQAQAAIVNGFIDCFVQQLPMEYAVEINRLIDHEMENSIG
ncbi:Fe-S cluster assembly protein SufB [bacterium]|nr:Fe-S cluster assembly protein SufB [bacterium]